MQSFATLRDQLDRRRENHLYRSRLVVDGPQSISLHIDHRTYLNFCSNDYLGLANHPKVIKALRDCAERYGVGSGASHLVNGHSRVHHELEEALAEYTGRARALLFSTGYMANLGVVGALLTRGDAVFEDRLNHASLLDAGLLSGAKFKRYPHGDVEKLKELLLASSAARKLVVSDGVFSMDGDLAPLKELAKACRQADAWLMVDDAHGLGCIGETGRGSMEYLDLSEADVPVLVGTLGKAFGTAGAFVAGSEDLIETLIQNARTYIYTTALPPAVAGATLASLQVAQEESWRRQHLLDLIRRFRDGAQRLGYALMNSSSPIQPILVGSNQAALALSEGLKDKGFLVTAIRPPTVPQGTARLRVTLCAEHSEHQVDQLLEALGELTASDHADSAEVTEVTEVTERVKPNVET